MPIMGIECITLSRPDLEDEFCGATINSCEGFINLFEF